VQPEDAIRHAGLVLVAAMRVKRAEDHTLPLIYAIRNIAKSRGTPALMQAGVGVFSAANFNDTTHPDGLGREAGEKWSIS
jgi:hypothetical protein